MPATFMSHYYIRKSAACVEHTPNTFLYELSPGVSSHRRTAIAFGLEPVNSLMSLKNFSRHCSVLQRSVNRHAADNHLQVLVRASRLFEQGIM